MPNNLILRRAGPADARPLAELFQLATPQSPHPLQTRHDVACFLEDPRNFQIVAEQGGRLVSSIAMMYHPWNDAYELGCVLTHPDSRRRGLAPRLRQRVVDCVRAEALGEVFFRSRRARGPIDLCSPIDPPMVATGHAAGRSPANGPPATQLAIFSIPSHARFVHVTPPVADGTTGAFLRERIYRQLGLPLAPGEYPPDSVVGAPSDWSLEWGNLVVDYNPNSPRRTLEILAIRAGSSISEHFSGDLDQILRAIPGVEHITVTVLADKIELLRYLSHCGFELAAYLPAWYKGGAFRYDCVQLTKRRHAQVPMTRECGDILSTLQPEIRSAIAPSRRDAHSTFRPFYAHGGSRYV